ncbi:MAG: GNAT family N-acetyltransferase [Kangiellaceae bacterium]
MKIANTQRLSFALMTRDDADFMYKLNLNPEVMRYINGGVPSTKDDIKNVQIPRMESYVNEEKGWGLWIVSRIDNAEQIGFVLVRPMQFFTDSPEYKNIELGWRFTQESWGNGYATEAAENIKQALIKKGNIEKFTAIAMEDNLASIQIMKKLGLKYVKTDIHKDPLGDEEVVFYELSVK